MFHIFIFDILLFLHMYIISIIHYFDPINVLLAFQKVLFIHQALNSSTFLTRWATYAACAFLFLPSKTSSSNERRSPPSISCQCTFGYQPSSPEFWKGEKTENQGLHKKHVCWDTLLKIKALSICWKQYFQHWVNIVIRQTKRTKIFW